MSETAGSFMPARLHYQYFHILLQMNTTLLTAPILGKADIVSENSLICKEESACNVAQNKFARL